jgi:protein ImuB
MLFACIYVPDFSVQAATRMDEPSIGESPVAILDGPESLLRVFACNEAARARGVEIRMTRLQAEACGELVLRKRVPAQEESGQAALLDCAYSFSPRVESTSAGIVTVDVTGTESLFGTPQEIGRELLHRPKCHGFDVHIGIAANADTALHAARGWPGISVIAPGEEAQHLAPLPVEILQPSDEMLEVFDSWGIRTFESLAVLPPIPLTERLGQKGFHLQRLAQGEVQRELVPADPPLCFGESTELEEPLELLEPLAFILNRLLEQITARLESRSLATDYLRTELGLEIYKDRQIKADSYPAPHATYLRTLKLPVPTQDSKLLLKLLQLDLAAHPPNGAVRKITVAAEPARIRVTQAGLFQPLAPEPGRLEIALARLRALVGEQDERGRGRVGSPSVVDSHQPDNFQVRPFRSDASSQVRECLPSPRLALRLFRPPLSARVELNRERPRTVAFGGIKLQVVNSAGPWRGSGQWWSREGRWKRDEWELVLHSGSSSGLYRVFCDLVSGQWFVEGMYD